MIKNTNNNPSLFSSLSDMLNQSHPLYQLADKIDWGKFETAFQPLYCQSNGRPGKPIRLMQKRALRGAQILRPLLLDMDQCPLPPAEPEVLQAGDHQAVVGIIHYDFRSQCTPSGSVSATVTV